LLEELKIILGAHLEARLAALGWGSCTAARRRGRV